MVDATHRLALILEAKNEASKELQNVRKDLAGVQDDAFGFSGVLNTILGVAGGMGVWKLGQRAIELSKMGAAADRAAEAFERRLGGDATAALEKLRAASQGTISDMDLMQAATRAQMLGVADDAETLSGLLEVAARRGRDMGMSTADAFSDIVTGIGRLSPMILDNLGIVMDAKGTYEAYAQALGKSADALTDVEKRQALVNRVLQEATGDFGALDAAGNWEALAAAQANLRVETGKLVSELLMETGALEKATAAAKEGISVLQTRGALAEAEKEYADSLELAVEAGALSEQQARRLEKAARDLAVQYVYTGQSTEDLAAAYHEMNAELLASHPEIERYLTNQAELRDWTAANAKGMYGFAAAVDTATSAVARLSDEELRRAIRAGQAAGTGLIGGWEPGLEGRLRSQAAQDALALQMAADAAAEREAERAAREHASTMEALYREQQAALRSMAESILAPTAVTPADMFRAQTGALGGYVEKWDESARRLQDIANRGAASPWWEILEIPAEVLAQGEQAVQIWAMETAEAVRRGVRPDLIDWDAFDRAAEAFVRDQEARERTVAMAMERLGGGVAEADVRQMLGVPADATEEALAVGQAFQRGLGATDLAGTVTQHFIEDLQIHYEQWQQAGVVTIGYFAQGLESGLGDTGGRVIKALWPWLMPALDRYYNNGITN
jgi:hypothetical protein